MAADISSQGTIREDAKTCLDQFAEDILLLKNADTVSVRRTLQDEFGRFKLWTANIGVFADVQASLDFRLRELPDVKELFMRQLETLMDRLLQLHEDLTPGEEPNVAQDEEVSDSSPNIAKQTSVFEEWDSSEILQSIHETIDWLHRLSNLVRKASFVNQNQRAMAFELKDEEGNDLTKTLTDLYSFLVKREVTDLNDHLVKRLVETMIIRRKRILYRRSRQQRWALQQVKYTAKKLEAPDQPRQVSASELNSIPHGPGLVQGESTSLPVRTALRRAPSQLTATTLEAEKYRKVVAPSRISKATTAPLSKQDKLLVPPPPRAAKEGKDFVCDYCCLILQSREALIRDRWA